MTRSSQIGRIKYRLKADAYSVMKTWKRLKRWSTAYLPQDTGGGDAKPATVVQLRSFEKAIGTELPEDVRESYRIYNGQCGGCGIIYGLAVEPLKDCLNHWTHWKDGAERSVRNGSAPILIPGVPHSRMTLFAQSTLIADGFLSHTIPVAQPHRN